MRPKPLIALLVVLACSILARAQPLAPAGDDDKEKCRAAMIHAMQALLEGNENDRTYFLPPTGDKLKQFDRLMAMATASKRLQAAMDKVNSEEFRKKDHAGQDDAIDQITAALKAATVEITGDSATLTYSMKSGYSASGSTTQSRRLVRKDGRWLVDAEQVLGLTDSPELLDYLDQRIAAIEGAIKDVEAGKEKPPLLGEPLIKKKMFEQMMLKGMKNKPDASRPARTPERPRPEPVDPKPAPGELRRASTSGRLRTLVFPSPTLIATGASHTPDSLVLWELSTLKKLRAYSEPGIEMHVLSLAATHDGARLLAGGQDFESQSVAARRAASPDRNPYAEDVMLECEVRVWDRETGRLIRKLPGDGFTINSIDVSPDDRLVAYASAGGRIHIADLASGDSIKQLDASKTMHQVAGVRFSPDGATLAAGLVNEDRESIIVYRVSDWTKQRTYSLPRATGKIELVPGGSSIACAALGAIAIFDAGEKPISLLLSINLGAIPARVNSIAFSSDGAWALSAEGVDFDMRGLASLICDSTPQIRVYNTHSREQIAMLSGHADAVWKAAFAPDGQSIVSVSTDGTIRVWDLPEPIKASHPAP